MHHGTLTVVTALRPDAVEDARRALEELSRAIQARAPHPFRNIPELYFAHWGIGGDEFREGRPPEAHEDRCLLMGADLRLEHSLRGRKQMRAAVDLLVDRLAAQPSRLRAMFDALYSHCEDYPARGLGSSLLVKHYLLAHAVPYNTRHIDFAYRVASVEDVRELVALRTRVEECLNEPSRERWVERSGAEGVLRALRHRLAPSLSRLSGPVWQHELRAALRTAALTTLAYLPVDVPLRLLLRLKNRFARPRTTHTGLTVEPDAVREGIEARQGPVQNSMILVTAVPEHWLGALRQRFFMALINWRLLRNVVGLNDTRTIHIARWALFKQGARRQLLFMVTYDESWEAYMDTFLDHEDMSSFLKLIWSGSRGFPSGLPFVEPFKRWVRCVQCPTQAHYSAFLHAGARPQPFALTDLQEFFALRRVLSPDSTARREVAAEQRALDAFLEQGRLPYQDKCLSPRQATRLLWEQRHPSPPVSLPTHRSEDHVTAP